ncbi:MAG TPA: gfo/Idh/MocA family oxidoreductase, partial [Planctomycetaceae bacterium]|nr:gfo/Idh/MocA family oxidoreductase [Planctomycetaceae bacterium]
MKESSVARRLFLGRSVGAFVCSAAASSKVAGAAANDRIRLAVIGVGGRGTHLLRLSLAFPEIEVTALCDIEPSHLNRGLELVQRAGHRRPAGYGERGPKDYRRMLERKEIDAVIIATPMQDHAVMAIDSLRAGKAVLSEVAAAMTLEECWGLVR